ncbi:TIGR02301 family protein [Mesorhizobium opportunistum]|uniref:TIGR02301 family protein n=1 Tax=Mesorhizobium opportunistum TaxID=593909 RepID=A0ABV1YEW8_9HYPH|nr:MULTISPECIES: TIGR02301 family protein [unclassified Mesorhizobium]MCA0032027.1 TIGR02301 family protein [Mesorhizobium sp. B263B2A]TIN93638.1 MAG: TIGR02301 family protein [Mesorhizobium sp.]TJU95944.1 MAG: TIGR02301 family protein [Mesorhizobium sp.]TJV07336.1 MAG: TIGR02301 family protein [Mesorhizobium sp.]TJV15282.1 MAG: TIGR02301 family protein [Mesorhizobium sp.]
MSRTSLLVVLCLAASTAVAARPASSAEAPFEPGLMRLAEVLGSLHFLRNLCGEKGDQWRVEMEKLLDSENPDAERRARFIASFNRGYRSFGGTYTQCTASATEAISRYMKEGETLTRDIASRYGN